MQVQLTQVNGANTAEAEQLEAADMTTQHATELIDEELHAAFDKGQEDSE